MHLPEIIQERIEKIIHSFSPAILKKAQENLSSNYRQKNTSDSVFNSNEQSIAYLATRLPATFATVFSCMERFSHLYPNFSPTSLLDVGAGPATASLALSFLYPAIQSTYLIEKNLAAIQLGQKLLTSSEIANISWMSKDMTLLQEFPKADLCIFSYSLNEITNIEKMLEQLIQTRFSVFVFIEPGTPVGYQNILRARAFFLNKKYHVLAPCPHQKPCPIKTPDWCHFSVRLERTKLHKMLKGGALGYEDEKYSYLIVSSENFNVATQDRIIRHPFIGKGHQKFTVCSTEGLIKERTITKKDKEVYKNSKDLHWGDFL